MAKPSPKKQKQPNAAKLALRDLDRLVLLDGVFEDEAGQAFQKLLKWMDKKEDADEGLQRYGKLWRLLMESQSPRESAGNLFQDHFLERLLEDPNVFHQRAETLPFEKLPESLTMVYKAELEILLSILKTDWETVVCEQIKNPFEVIPAFHPVPAPLPVDGFSLAKTRRKLKERLLHGKATNLAQEIAHHFHQEGFGDFGRYRAFRWEVSHSGEGRLQGIDNVDPIQLKNLLGYDEARKALLENIEGFVAGKGGNNVLIYGERGTGKSSTVKALLNHYHDTGLRLVEVLASHLNEYHDILRHLKGRKEKFVLFVDDLSFEENETSYKGLKALLEGTIEATPPNVILIATSNRRHLIREFFDDRAGAIQKEGEIHGADTIEEKLSLSDRFGLVVSFYSPNQDIYLQIVENWAKVEGLKLPAEELRRRALQWALYNNGRSGRTARQFINDLKGKL